MSEVRAKVFSREAILRYKPNWFLRLLGFKRREGRYYIFKWGSFTPKWGLALELCQRDADCDYDNLWSFTINFIFGSFSIYLPTWLPRQHFDELGQHGLKHWGFYTGDDDYVCWCLGLKSKHTDLPWSLGSCIRHIGLMSDGTWRDFPDVGMRSYKNMLLILVYEGSDGNLKSRSIQFVDWDNSILGSETSIENSGLTKDRILLIEADRLSRSDIRVFYKDKTSDLQAKEGPWFDRAMDSYPTTRDYLSNMDVSNVSQQFDNFVRATYNGKRERFKRDIATETHHFQYVLKSGVIQHCLATISVSEMEWRRKWLKHIPVFRKIQRYIDIEFSEEVGERTGSWKGGSISCSERMQYDETPYETLKRVEQTRKF